MNPEIFIQAFMARLLPLYQELTLGAIRHLQMENYPANAALAAAGGLLALVVYYAFGIFLRRMPERVSTPEQQARVESMRAVAHHWLPWLLILSPTPVGGVVVMAAGFFRLNKWLTLAVVIAAEALFRAMPYLR